PVFVDLIWRYYRPDISFKVVADVTLYEHHASVTQRLDYSGQKVPPKLQFKIPPGVQGVRIAGGSEVLRDDTSLLIAPGGAGNKEPLVLTFEIPIPSRGKKGEPFRQLNVPLLQPENVTRLQTKVRVWTPPGTVALLAQPELANGAWRDEGTEVVPERKDRLPSLVLLGMGVSPPPLIRVFDSAPALLAQATIDRVLMQVTVDDK